MLTLGVWLALGCCCAISFCLGYLTRQLREEPESDDSYADWTFDPFLARYPDPECVDALHRSGDTQ